MEVQHLFALKLSILVGPPMPALTRWVGTYLGFYSYSLPMAWDGGSYI
jgi:hypothetical protein